jgi:uncharacterized membrane protein (UPF0127 family)
MVWDFLLMSIMSDLILVGVSGFVFGAATDCFEPTKNKIAQQKIMKKLNFKFCSKRSTFAILFCLIVTLIILRTPKNLDAKEVLEFNRDLQNYNVKLQILDQNNHEVTKFFVAIADDDYKKMYGLMNLGTLPKEYGMLFPFFRSQVLTMWMKNTHIPLDMIFIDSKNIITTIKTNAEPKSLEIISSEKPVKKVLEINGGLSEKLGIKVGQKIFIN